VQSYGIDGAIIKDVEKWQDIKEALNINDEAAQSFFNCITNIKKELSSLPVNVDDHKDSYDFAQLFKGSVKQKVVEQKVNESKSNINDENEFVLNFNNGHKFFTLKKKVTPTTTIVQLKNYLREQEFSDPGDITLSSRGIQLVDHKTLKDYNIILACTIIIIFKVHGGSQEDLFALSFLKNTKAEHKLNIFLIKKKN